jgi:DNA-binding winged helix-turn-helix (wHTH) protein
VFGPFRLDIGQRLLFRDSEEIPLPPKILDTLIVLVAHQGRVLDKNYLMKTLWPDSFVEECSLARNISLLRKILGESPEDQRFIQTMPKRGYRFVASVLADESASSHQELTDLRITPDGETLMERADQGTNGYELSGAPKAAVIESQSASPARLAPDATSFRFRVYATMALQFEVLSAPSLSIGRADRVVAIGFQAAVGQRRRLN